MDVKKILKEATDNGASDIFIVAGRPLTYKSKGMMECLNEIRMIPKETFEFVTSIYALAERDISNSRKPEMMTSPSLYREYHVTE